MMSTTGAKFDPESFVFPCSSDIICWRDQVKSTITEKMAVYFPNNALRSKNFRRANGCLLKDRRNARGRFVYSAKISHN